MIILKKMAGALLPGLYVSSLLNAQISTEACQTVLQDRTYEQMRREVAIISQVRNVVRGRSETASADTVPVFFTVFRDDGGTFAGPQVDEALADGALNQLNQYFAPIRLHFSRLGAINYIDNTAFTGFGKHHHLAAISYLSSALNVYTKSGSGSFAQFPATPGPAGDSPEAVSANNRSNMMSLNSAHFLTTTFAHEMGHSYGLLHTFEGARVYNNPIAPTPGYAGSFLDHPYGAGGNILRRELVMRSPDPEKPFTQPNFANAGDFIEDTPAFCVSTATYPAYYPDRSSEDCRSYPFDQNRCNGCIIVDCNYEGDYVDYNGDTLVNTGVSIRNLMSYTSCRSEFTPGQYERMAFYHEFVRKLQYEAGRDKIFSDSVLFEDSGMPMDDIILQFRHSGAYHHSNTVTNSAGSFQAMLYAPLTRAHLMKAGSALDPNYQTSPWVQASSEEIIAHSYRREDWAQGVDARDLEALRQHLSGLKLLNGYRQIAADLNRDGRLTEADAQLLEQLINGEISQWSEHTGPWRFLPAYIAGQYGEAFRQDPFQMEIEGVAYQHFAPYLEADWEYRPEDLPVGMRGFRAVKLGDLDGSSMAAPGIADPPSVEAPEDTPDADTTPSPTPSAGKFGCYPNPTSGDIHIDFVALTAGEGELQVSNRFFRPVYSREVYLLEGVNEFLIDGHEFPAGILVVILKTKEGIFYKKIVKTM